MSDIHESGGARGPSDPAAEPTAKPITAEPIAAEPIIAEPIAAELSVNGQVPADGGAHVPRAGGAHVPLDGRAHVPGGAHAPLDGRAHVPGGAVPVNADGPVDGGPALVNAHGLAPAGAAWPPLAPGRRPSPVTWRDAAVALAVTLVVAALGAPLALLWAAIGPHAEIVMVEGGPTLDDFNTEAYVGGDVTFGVIAVGMGIVAGAGAWALRRWRGPAIVVALALGGIAGAWITWKLGHRIGLSEYRDRLQTPEPGDRFEQPMKLRAEGLLFLEATVAVIVYVVNAAWSHRPDLGAEPRHPDVPISPSGYPPVSSAPSAPAAPPAAPAPPGASTASSPPA